MNLHQLYYFREVAHELSYTKAAEKLFMAQSSLSHSIALLERELKAPLFHKVGRNIHLTPYGKKLLEHTERALAEIDTAKSSIQTMMNPYSGTIRLSICNTLSFRFLPKLIREFYKNPLHKDIKIEFTELQAKFIVEQIKQMKIDLGFGAYYESDKMIFAPILREKFVLIVSSNNYLSCKNLIAIEDLQDEKLVTYNRNSGTRRSIDELFKVFNITPNFVYEVENEAMIATIVSANLGVGIVPSTETMFFSAYDVKQIELSCADITRSLYLIWHKYEYMSPTVKLFRDFVLNSAAETMPDGILP